MTQDGEQNYLTGNGPLSQAENIREGSYGHLSISIAESISLITEADVPNNLIEFFWSSPIRNSIAVYYNIIY